MMRRAALASALMLATLPSVPTTAAEALPSSRTEVTLYHWWSSPSERAAVEALGALFQKATSRVSARAAADVMFSSTAMHSNLPRAFMIVFLSKGITPVFVFLKFVGFL